MKSALGIQPRWEITPGYHSQGGLPGGDQTQAYLNRDMILDGALFGCP